MSMKLPSFEALKEISDRLKKANIKHALGGSGMLAHLGLLEEVRDWDVTTDASRDQVEALIQDLEYEYVKPSGLYASEYLFKLKIKDTAIDLIGSFAIKTDKGIFKLPTIISGEWDGVPVGSPGAWAKAYELMGRSEKAKMLSEYIKNNLS